MEYIEFKDKKYSVENESLFLINKGIQYIHEIKGLEKLTNLRVLNLKDNEIKEFQIPKSLKNLEELHFDFNEISEIKEINHLTNLKYLSLHSNKISDIQNLDKLIELKELYLGDNQISVISGLENLSNLESLFLFKNQISSITNLNDLKNLKVLRLDFNSIQNIDGLGALIKLEHLGLSYNKITKIEKLDKLRSLKILELACNQIQEMKGIENLVNLEEIYIYINKILKIEALENLTRLKKIHLYKNRITKIEGLEQNKLLQEILLFQNEISELSGVGTLENLIYLDLNDNLITIIEKLDKNVALINLNLAGNQILKIENLDSLVNLKYLSLQNNKINKIRGLENLTNLKEIHLRDNPLVNSYERYLTEKTIDANQYKRYCKTKKIEGILPPIFYDKDKSYEDAIFKSKMNLNSIKDDNDFINLGTHREDPDIKTDQNLIFLNEKPVRKKLKDDNEKNRIIFHLFQTHSLKGIKPVRKDKVSHFLYFINHFWDKEIIRNDGVLIYNDFESRVCEKIDEFLDLSLKVHSSVSFLNKPNVLIFPENSIPYCHLKKLQDYSKKNELLIIGGLEHLKIQHSYENKAFIIDHGIIDYQVKQTPVTIYDKKNNSLIKEKIKCEKLPQIKVFETSIGPIAIFICKDFLRLCEIIPYWACHHDVEYIIIPSFTNKLLPFYSKILNLFDTPDAKDLKIIFNSMGEYGGSEVFSVLENHRVEESFRINSRDNVGENIVVRPLYRNREKEYEEDIITMSPRIWDIEKFLEYIMKKKPVIETIQGIPFLTSLTGVKIIKELELPLYDFDKYVARMKAKLRR